MDGAENMAVVRAVSLLVSRCLGSCRCSGSGLCGLHGVEPVVEEPQGRATWTVETCEAALVAGGHGPDSGRERGVGGGPGGHGARRGRRWRASPRTDCQCVILDTGFGG